MWLCFTAVSTVCVQKACLAQLVVHSALYTADSMGIIVLGIELVSVALVPMAAEYVCL